MVTSIPVLNGGTAGRNGPSGAAVDCTSAGVLVLDGAEAKDFLQRISTNDVSRLIPGRAVQTVLTTEKGRIIDVLTVFMHNGSIVLLTGEHHAEAVMAWLEKFIIMEDITIRDGSLEFVCAVIPDTSHRFESVSDAANPVDISTLSYYGIPSRLIVTGSVPQLSTFLSSHAISLMSSDVFDEFRILNGIPAMGREITEKTNPLEAGLRPLVDFSKGCYIGQEVIARLDTYEKIQRILCTLRLSGPVEAEKFAELVGEEAVHGYITTISRPSGQTDGAVRALAIVRADAAVPGARFTVKGSGVDATIERIHASASGS